MRGHSKYVFLLSIVTIALAATACSGKETPSSPSPAPSANPNLTPPVPDSPVDDAQLSTLRPTLTVRNGTSDQGGARTYEFQISDRSDFSLVPTSFIASFLVVVNTAGVAEGAGGMTTFTPDQDLQPTTRMFWRARMRQGSSVSDWSPSSHFKTKLVGFVRAGELYDPLIHEETVGTQHGSTTFIADKGLRINNANSWVRYPLPRTITNGEFSVEVEGLFPNSEDNKARIFSMMDGGNDLFNSRFIANVQYRGLEGNPPNCISFKAVFGNSNFQVEPSRAKRTASVFRLDISRTYLWKATWGNEFRLVVIDGGLGGSEIYNYGIPNGGTYNPNPHVAYLGANNGPFGQESGSWAGAIYRNVWIGDHPRPESLGSALQPLR